MFDAKTKEIAIRLRPHGRGSSCIRQQANFAEVRTVAKRCGHFSVRHNDVHNAFLNKEHLVPDCAFFDDDVT